MYDLVSRVRRCAQDYNMIEDGDKIAVGVSGGKDSLALLCAMEALRRFSDVKFSLEAISLDMGFDGADFGEVAELCRRIGVPYSVVKTEIKQVVFDIRKEKNPCSLCARMRRGALHAAASERGMRKVALGHHFDDAVETFLLSLLYEGRISCFKPVTWLDRKGITVIRPMLYLSDRETREFSASKKLPVISSACPADKHTKRQEVKETLESLRIKYPDIKEKIFGAMRRYPLDGWE